jgi:hypothetical protein
VASVAPTSAALIACDSVSDPGSPVDASTNPVTVDASDGAPDVVVDAGPSCYIVATYFDSGVYYDGGDGAIDVGCIYELPCGLPPTLMSLGCGVYFSDTVDSSLPDAHAFAGCNIAEGSGCTDGNFTPGPNGAVGIICTDCLGGGGRRPRGLKRLKHVTAKTRAGAYFAQMAHEESASVHAFRCMKQELLRFGAPVDLVNAATRAEREEIVHARLMSRHARAFGGVGVPARTKKTVQRSLEAMAIENAVEGCVNETFGALLMTWQAQHAASPDLRNTLARIARDETGHAALSQAVASWAESQLGERARMRVQRARARAVEKLRTQAARSPITHENKWFEKLVGLPTSSERSALIDKMIDALHFAV